MDKIPMIPHNNKICHEIRPAYFLKAFQKEILPMRIFSFGRCNFNCPYCKRDGQYIDNEGNIIGTRNTSFAFLIEKVKESIENNQVIRLSGGDPVMFPALSLELLKKAKELNGITSIAHNGSSPKFIEMILPYLDFAAIDLKAANKEEFNTRAGLTNGQGDKFLKNSLRVQEILSNNGILVDVRTCIFSSTSIDDMLKMAEIISNSGKAENKFWTIRTYKPVTSCNWKSLNIETTIDYIKIVKEEYPELKMGLRAKWEPEGFLYF